MPAINQLAASLSNDAEPTAIGYSVQVCSMKNEAHLCDVFRGPTNPITPKTIVGYSRLSPKNLARNAPVHIVVKAARFSCSQSTKKG